MSRHKYYDSSIDASYNRKITKKTTAAISFRVLIATKSAFLKKLKQKGIGLREYFGIIVDRELGK